jgi:hypothetical protein
MFSSVCHELLAMDIKITVNYQSNICPTCSLLALFQCHMFNIVVNFRMFQCALIHFMGCIALITFTSIDFSDADVRLTRRIRRDTIEKGRDIKTVLDQVHSFLPLQFPLLHLTTFS